MKNKHVMIDLETLGTVNMPVVLSIGVVKFNPWEDYRNKPIKTLDYQYYKPTLESCINLGCSIQDDTLNWWKKQNREVIEEVLSDNGRESIQRIMKDLYRFCNGRNVFWGQGAIFDYDILEDIANTIPIGVPWKYHQIRDSRTLFDLAKPEMPPATHNALDDCYRQIIGVQSAFRKLQIPKPVQNTKTQIKKISVIDQFWEKVNNIKQHLITTFSFK